MSLFNPLTWDLDFFLLRGGNGTAIKQKRKERIVVASIYLVIFSLSAFWLGLVTKHVPEPYLDEVFHVPQAQAYCRGELGIWDPKLTTPPGLYIVSALLIKFLRGGACTVLKLRTIDCLALVVLLSAAQGCRRYITGTTREKSSSESKGNGGSAVDWDAIHTAANVCLFPLIFFFSGLYYTDVVSTCVVVIAYEHFLKGNQESGSVSRGIFTYLIGVMALMMRQTNIFWVAVFMGGLEITRTFNGKRSVSHESRKDPGEKKIANLKSHFNDFVLAGHHGEFHDPNLEGAGVLDFAYCAITLGIAVISHLRRVTEILWPYIALLISFAGFVAWNGGVVLGDKSNHVATIHLPQMLYIWPFMAFFSIPLLYPSAFGLLSSVLPFAIRWPAYSLGVRKSLRASTVIWLLGSTVVAIAIVHFNTIIHPFTLADNRHYVFYVFRYTIRRHPLVKYVLAPLYVLCSFLILRTLAGPPVSFSFTSPVSAGKAMAGEAIRPGQSTPSDQSSPSASSPPAPTISFTLIWLVSTTLSLITAPLVEPRYFIVPWVIWRLHVPSLPRQGPTKESNAQPKTKRRDTPKARGGGWTKYWVDRGHDHRLWFETVWFLFISLMTGYVFLFKGFEWPQEKGKVQRFMW